MLHLKRRSLELLLLLLLLGAAADAAVLLLYPIDTAQHIQHDTTQHDTTFRMGGIP